MCMGKQRVILTGFMCSGKTTVAKALGEKWNCEVVDLDEAIAAAEGRPSSTIIEEDGEEVFRAIERRVLGEVLDNSSVQVIALGGGAWIQPDNREGIARNNCVSVWLDAPFELCWSRISGDSVRRPLAVEREQSNRLYEERQAAYSMADLRIAVGANDTLDNVVEAIDSALNLLNDACSDD